MTVKFSFLELHHRCNLLYYHQIINFLASFIAQLVSNWSVSIDNKTATSIQVSWQDLATLLSQSIFHYITVIKSSNGSIVNGNILQENTTSNVFYGLSPYMEYRLTLLCVNDNWEVYKSSEVTEWTEESGMIIPLPAQ